jgi:hypothetical protein
MLMTVPVVDALAGALDEPAAGAELGADAAVADELLLELHAAASSAAATGTPIFTGMGIRVSHELAIFRRLRSWAGVAAVPLRGASACRCPSSLACRHMFTEMAAKGIDPEREKLKVAGTPGSVRDKRVYNSAPITDCQRIGTVSPPPRAQPRAGRE